MCEDSVKTAEMWDSVFGTHHARDAHKTRLARFLARRYFESRLTGAVPVLDLEHDDHVVLWDLACNALTPDELQSAREEAEAGVDLPVSGQNNDEEE